MMSFPHSIRQLVFIVAIGLVTALVLLMAWPRFSAAIQFLPVERSIRSYYQSRVISTEEIRTLIQRAAKAQSVEDYYGYHSGLSLLHYLQATAPDVSLFERRNELDQAISEAELALAGAPLQPELWLRLVQAGFGVFLPHDELAQSWRMAIWSGRVEPLHLLQRVQLGLALQPSLGPDGLDLLRDQILLAWNLNQHQFAQAMRQGRVSRKHVQFLLANTHPDVLADMEEVLGPVDT